MQQATFTLSGAELNLELIEKIKSLFNGRGEDIEVFISVRPKKSSALRKETREEYFARLDKAIGESRAGQNSITFESVGELEKYAQNLILSHAKDPV